MCGQNDSSRDLAKLMEHAEAISAELSALLPGAGLPTAVLHSTAADSDPADKACSHSTCTANAAEAASTVAAAAAGGGAGQGTGSGVSCCDLSRLQMQTPSHVNSSKCISAVQQFNVATKQAVPGTEGSVAQLSTSTCTAACAKMLAEHQLALANSSSCSDGSSSSSNANPAAPVGDHLGPSGAVLGTTLSGPLANLTVSEAALKPQQQKQQQCHHQPQHMAPAPASAAALIGIQVPLFQPVASMQQQQQLLSTTAVGSQAHVQQSAPLAAVPTEAAVLPRLNVAISAQSGVQQWRQPLQSQPNVSRLQRNIVVVSRPGVQPTAVLLQQRSASVNAAAALAARAAIVANIHRRALLSSAAAAAGVAGGSPLGRRKRRSSESTHFDFSWPSRQQQEQQEQERECSTVSADGNGVTKHEAKTAAESVDPAASKKAKIDVDGLLRQMSAVVATAYDAAAAKRAVAAVTKELWCHGYIEAKH